jgi:hypothetical protein
MITKKAITSSHTNIARRHRRHPLIATRRVDSTTDRVLDAVVLVPAAAASIDSGCMKTLPEIGTTTWLTMHSDSDEFTSSWKAVDGGMCQYSDNGGANSNLHSFRWNGS